MARIKIKDLPKDMKISKEEMRKVFGGIVLERSDRFRNPSVYWEPTYNFPLPMPIKQ